MMDPDELLSQGAMRRIGKSMIALGAAGVIGALVWRGWTWGAGFAMGAAVSWLNFRWLKQVAYSVGSERARPRTAVFLGLRYVILGGGAYVILSFSKISLPALLAGLFVAVAAVLAEIVFELMYARN
jgi:hypothetical protein